MVIQQHLCLAQVPNFSKTQWSSWCKSGPDFCGPGSAPATPPSQELQGRAAVCLPSEVASGLYIPHSKERPQQRPVSFYRHSLKASAKKKARVPNPPPTHSNLTTGRLCCSSFRRIQSFKSTRRLEAEYTRKGGEEHRSYGTQRKQTKPGLLPLSPGGNEGRRATRHADSSHGLLEDTARREENKGSGERPHAPPRRATTTSPSAGGCQAAAATPRLPAAHLPSSDSAWESENRPAKGREQLPAGAQRGGKPPVPAGPQPPAPPRNGTQAQAQAPAGGTRARPSPLPHLAAGRKGPARCLPAGPWRPGAASRTPGSVGTAGAAAPPGRRPEPGLPPPPP